MDNYNWQNSNAYQNVMYNTNVYLVTSLDEAIMRTTQYGSDMVYFDQNKPVFYRIKVDMEGRKSWNVFDYIVPKPEDIKPVTMADIRVILDKLQSLESKISSQEVTHDGPNEQRTVQ